MWTLCKKMLYYDAPVTDMEAYLNDAALVKAVCMIWYIVPGYVA